MTKVKAKSYERSAKDIKRLSTLMLMEGLQLGGAASAQTPYNNNKGSPYGHRIDGLYTKKTQNKIYISYKTILSDLKQVLLTVDSKLSRFDFNFKLVEKMKSEDDYVTVRIPRQLANEIDEIIQSGALGYRSRAEMVSEAIRLRIELLRFNKTMISRTVSQKTDNDLLVSIRETFLAHTVIGLAKGKTLPPDHLDLKQLEEYIRQYVTRRTKRKGIEITKEYLDELIEDLLEYHKEILEGLALMTRH